MSFNTDVHVISGGCDTSRPKRCSQWQKYAKTSVLVFSWMCLGLYSEVLGPTLPTLRQQTGANYEQIGSALAVRAAGMLSGSIVGAWSSDRFVRYRAFQMSIGLTVASLTNFAIPWVRSLPLLSFVLYVAGCTHGFHTTNGNPLLASIWQSEASGPFSLMHAGYGLGGAAAPALVAIFATASSNSSSNSSSSSSSNLTDVNLELSEAVAVNYTTTTVRIDAAIPYNIIAVILLTCALCFLTFAGFDYNRCCSACRNRTASEPKILPLTQSDSLVLSGRRLPGHVLRRLVQRLQALRQHTKRTLILLWLAVFVIYFAIVGNERVFGKFMFSYALFGPVQLNRNKGYILNLIYWLCFGLARVITCFLALVCADRILMFGVVLGTLGASIGLVVIPPTEQWFFAMTCIFSLFKSPLFPTTLAVINRSYEITGFLVLIVNFGSAVGASLMQYAAGSLIENYGQNVFPYLVFGSACVVLVTATLLLILLRTVGDRFVRRAGSVPTAIEHGVVPQDELEPEVK